MKYSQETLNNWTKAYLNNHGEDPHSLFAELEGLVARNCAKKRCYEIMWSSNLIRDHLESLKGGLK